MEEGEWMEGLSLGLSPVQTMARLVTGSGDWSGQGRESGVGDGKTGVSEDGAMTGLTGRGKG